MAEGRVLLPLPSVRFPKRSRNSDEITTEQLKIRDQISDYSGTAAIDNFLRQPSGNVLVTRKGEGPARVSASRLPVRSLVMGTCPSFCY
jgi:hypothetical protein